MISTDQASPPAARTWRIAFLRRRFSPTGGAERYLLRLAAGLAAQGHSLTLYCEDWTPRENPFQSIRKVATNGPVEFARQVMRLPLRDQHEVIFSLERVPGCDLYRAGDGVHADWLAFRRAFAPVLGPIRSFLRSKNRQLCTLEAELFRPDGAKRVICNSRFVADQIVRRFEFPEEKIELIRNGVPFSQFSSGDRVLGRRALQLAEDDFAILLVGAGAERKGHAIARRVVSRLGTKQARLVIIDSPPALAMPHIYAAADVFFLPTLYDPFANVTLEALAAGLPVITSAQNGAAEIIAHGINGFVLPRADDDHLAIECLRRLLDPKERSRLRGPAQELARQYDLSHNISATVDLLNRLPGLNA